MTVADLKTKIDAVVAGIVSAYPFYKRKAKWLQRTISLKQYVREAFFFGYFTEAERDELIDYIDAKDVG